jgi:hypothetical protein
MRVVRVVHGYQWVKRRHEPYRSDLPPTDVRRSCEVVHPQASERVGDQGHTIRLRDRDNDGREKFAIFDPWGELVTCVWGRAEARAACRELIKTGAIVR